MKPVELVERAIGNSSKVGDIVLDGFGGSGSTTYNQTSAKQLSAYISNLKSQIASAMGKPSRRIMRIEF